MSPYARCTDGSKAEAEGTVISPARKKPKKHAEAAAHSMALSWWEGAANKTARI